MKSAIGILLALGILPAYSATYTAGPWKRLPAGQLAQTQGVLAAEVAKPPVSPTVIVPPPPRLRSMRAVRDMQGNLVAIPEYEDQVLQ